MATSKLIGAVLGVVLLLAVALAVFGNYITPSVKKEENFDKNLQTETVSKNENYVFEENINNQGLNSNLKILSSKIAESLTDLNSDGFVKLNNQSFAKALNPQKIVYDVLEKELRKIEERDQTEEKVIVTISEDKIIRKASPQEEEAYFKNFQKILNNQSVAVEGRSFKSINDFKILVDVFQDAVTSFYQIKVPESLLTFHKKEIGLLIKEKQIWEALLQTEQDPLRAIIALNQQSQIKKEMEDLNKDMGIYITKNNLAILWQ